MLAEEIYYVCTIHAYILLSCRSSSRHLWIFSWEQVQLRVDIVIII